MAAQCKVFAAGAPRNMTNNICTHTYKQTHTYTHTFRHQKGDRRHVPLFTHFACSSFGFAARRMMDWLCAEFLLVSLKHIHNIYIYTYMYICVHASMLRRYGAKHAAMASTNDERTRRQYYFNKTKRRGKIHVRSYLIYIYIIYVQEQYSNFHEFLCLYKKKSLVSRSSREDKTQFVLCYLAVNVDRVPQYIYI